MPFRHSDELAMLTRDLIIFYSRAFTNDSIHKAKEQLNAKNSEIRKQEAIVIAFCSGTIISLLIVDIYLLFLCQPHIPNGNWVIKLGSGIIIYYIFGVMIYIIFATGFCIQVFKKYQINYPFIFEID